MNWNAKEDSNSNLVSGRYNSSSLARAYEEGLEKLSIIDFSYYEPAAENVAFMSAPIIDNNQISAVAVMEISSARIDQIMLEKNLKYETSKSYIVESDFLMRSNSRYSGSNYWGS